MVVEDQEGVEEAEGAEEQMTRWLAAAGAEEGRAVPMRNALAVGEEDTSGWEEAGALLHQV